MNVGAARGAEADPVAPVVGFEPGRDYTRAEIHAAVGGSRRACMPTHGGLVVAACLLRTLNPDTPRVVLCGTGPRNGPAGERLAEQGVAVPFFTRVAANRWRHEGAFAVAEVLESGAQYDAFVERSGRAPSSVSRVLVLRPA